MLLSPLASPSRFHASLALPLKHLAHHDQFAAEEFSDSEDECDEDDSDESDDVDYTPEPSDDPLALPVELIFDIVELAAQQRRTARSLCRVASWVRAVVLPVLYGTLVLHGTGSLPFDLIAEPYMGNRTLLESPLQHVRSVWLDVPLERAPCTLDTCPRLVQLALPLEAHATITGSKRWCAQETNALGLISEEPASRVRSFTVLGQSHPHRWAPLTSSPEGRAFLRGVTHLRILNLCLSHYIPLEYTPNLTHLCLPYFDLRLSPTSLQSASPTGSAASTSFTGLDYILAQPSLKMVVLTLNPRYWRFDELSLKGWAVRAMTRDPRLHVVAATRDDATRDWDVPKRDWEDEAAGGMSVWDKAVMVRRKFLARLSRNWDAQRS